MLESRGPALLWWGPDLVVLYNDAAMALLGEEQPARLGLPGAEAFPDLWPTLGPLLRRVLDDGVSAHLPGERLGEVFWAGSCAPVRGEDGKVLGVFTTAEDTTARVVAERRLATLRRLGEVAAARIGRADAAAVAAVDALTHNPDDLPFAALYTHDGRIAASYGLAPGAPALDADGDLGRAARRVVQSGEPELVAAQGPAMVLPVADRGALVLGLPLHRPVDEEYRAFLRLVADELTTAMCGDRPRGSADGGRFEESERYRTLVAQAPVGIWVTDPCGATTFVNDQVAQLWGRTADELAGTAWVDQVHAGDRAATVAAWSAAVRAGVAWEQGYRVVARDGSVRHVRSSARPLRGPDGEVTGFLGTTVDVTDERRAEETRRDVAAEHAARKVSDAAAARLRAMVQGLAAIVWEAEWDSGVRSLRFTFVSDRAEELLGHPARRWRDDPGFWPAIIHPDDREETLAYTSDRTAAGLDHDITYRAVAIDGRVVWLHQVVHVVTRPDGQPVVAQGLTVDVTEQKRAERHAELLAETGRLVGDEGTAEERLAALADLVMHDLGDAAVVSLIGPDGLARRVTVAHDDETVRAALLALAPTRLPPELVSAFAPGLPVLVSVTEELNRAAARDEPDAAARAQLGASNTLVVPLVIGGRVVGLLGFVNFDGARYYQPSELDLAAELGRRASLMLAADRQRARERHLHQVSADLASAAGVAEAARLLVARLGEVFDAGAMSVYLVEPERGIRLVHAVGYSQAALEEFAVVRFDDRIPIAEVVRTGEPEWIGNREDWRQRWPGVLDHGIAAGRHAAAALPLTAAGRVVGALGISFTTDREFPPDERDFVLALVAQAAPAFERAAAADERRLIAETLQTSLLPPTLPGLDRLALASRYLAGARGTQAGGDWYDVLPLDGGRVAIAVGDVVGQGAKAAAIMGQLRSVLSGYLLEGHDPVQAVERLDRFACRVPGAAGSTVACLLLDPETGELTWARAGHPPPLVTGPAGTRLLEGATGTVLAVRGRPPFTSGSARIEPGESIVLYTDGLVERRGELIDDGIERLAAAAARHQALAPPALTDALVSEALATEAHPAPIGEADGPSLPDPADDVAIIVARLVPAPLRLVLPAEAPRLRELRAALLLWTSAAGLNEDDTYDLQLALGEAAANAVEHAYRGGEPGVMAVELSRDPDGTVRARVRDEGSWRPPPDDRGYRGRGLELIRDVSSRMELDRGPTGTEVRFTLTPSPASARSRPPVAVPPAANTALRLLHGPGGRRIEIIGDLDLAGAQAIRDELTVAVRGGPDVTVDLRATTYLASAGIALLVEADRAARADGGRLRLEVSPHDVVRRALALSGVDGALEVDDGPGDGTAGRAGRDRTG
ncbi:hypothetical protein GCM10009609_21770 [Pseudonocardia aurantiaca]